MQWEKKICIRITARRIVAAILIAASSVNLVIVGAAFEAASTATPTPTLVTLTKTSTATFSLPTATPENTPTLISSPMKTPTLTSNPTFTSTPTATLTSTSTNLPTPTQCVPKTYWFVYYVQSGDTLYSLAPATGSTVDELMMANCLSSTLIIRGQILYVPHLPPTPTPSNTPVPPPDIVVTVFRVTGLAEILIGQKAIVVPVYVVVQNQGGVEADTFKLSAQHIGSSGNFTVPFTVKNQADSWYPYTTTSLGTGEAMAFNGSIMLPESPQGQTIVLNILADSCVGDEFMPSYCRVFESDESNNEAQPVTIKLPSNSPPSVTIISPEVGASYIYDAYDQEFLVWYKDNVVLTGYAKDPEDGILDDSSLTWSTDRTDVYKDPILGHGSSLTLTLLSDECKTGHTITLTARDSDGNVTAATRTINMSCPLY